MFDFLEYIARESNPFTAVDRLSNWAALKGVSPLPPTYASSPFTVTFATAATLIATSTFTSPDGTTYITSVDLPGLPGTSGTIMATCQTAGAVGNLTSGNIVNLTLQVPGINPVVTTGAIVGGADPETTDAFRTRMLKVYAQPAIGGSQSE